MEAASKSTTVIKMDATLIKKSKPAAFVEICLAASFAPLNRMLYSAPNVIKVLFNQTIMQVTPWQMESA
jgi:hypothetical protein